MSNERPIQKPRPPSGLEGVKHRIRPHTAIKLNCGLVELEIISAGKIRSPRGAMGKGTDSGAALIPKEYESNLWKCDVKFQGPIQKVSGQAEPLVRRFKSYLMMKLVAGPWGDLSEDFPMLPGISAKKR